jgi:hypothetical protein
MKVLFVILISFCLMLAASAAETKKDIRGFYPGMTKVQFERKVKDVCSATPCTTSDGGTLNFVFTEYLNPPILKQVEFIFVSNTMPADLISSISTQFKARAATYPAKGTEGILVATSRADGLGAVIAKWDLGKGLLLDLEIKGHEGKNFRMSLLDRKIETADTQAKRNADEERAAKFRAANPPPKF